MMNAQQEGTEMAEESTLDALARGMMGEMDSITTYEEAAARCEGEVKEFFLRRAREEKNHYNWLLEYYRALSTGALLPGTAAGRGESLPEFRPRVTPELLKAVGGSPFLSATVSSAVLLELDAMKNYRHRAEKADRPEVKALFDELSRWEQDHYDILVEIQAGSRAYWFDSLDFQPL